ncbi:MAG: ABC transporter permease [Candidatus Levyibacteriota bacterium]
MKKYLYSLLFFTILLLVWESFFDFFHVNTAIISSPSQIFLALLINWQILLPHVLQTCIETVIGFAVAILLGLLFSLLLFYLPRIRTTLYPALVISQTIPLIALAPLLLLWFGFGLFPKVIVVILYCFFPITVAYVDGLVAVDKKKVLLLQSMGASEITIFRLVRFPEALPSFFSGLKVAATYAFTGAIVGEYVGAYQGVGIYMQEAANSHAVALVFALIFVIIIASIMLFSLVILAEKIFVFYR